MDEWVHEGDVVRRKTLLREVYKEIRIWPKKRRQALAAQGLRSGEPRGAYTLFDGGSNGIRTLLDR
jgi:hypothetical protein